MAAGFDVGQDVGHELPVTRAGGGEPLFLGILLDAPHGPEQHVGLVGLVKFHRKRLAGHELAQSFLSRAHGCLEIFVLLDGEGEAGQGNERVAGAGLEPGVAGQHVFVAVLVLHMELVCGVDQTVEEAVARRPLLHLFLEQRLQPARLGLGGRGREHHALALADAQLEIAGHVEILVGGVAALLLLGIFDAAVPVGLEHELRLFGQLHVEVGVAGVHTGTYAVVHFLVVTAGGGVLVSELAHAAKGEERAEAQRRGRVGVDERIANEDAVFVVLEDDFFPKQHAAHAVEGGGNLVTVELLDVLVPLRTEVVALILVQAEVEFGAMLNHRAVERGEQHVVLVVQPGHGHHEQTVVLARVAVHDGRTGVCSRAVGA